MGGDCVVVVVVVLVEAVRVAAASSSDTKEACPEVLSADKRSRW